jgi:hypothetical protein
VRPCRNVSVKIAQLAQGAQARRPRARRSRRVRSAPNNAAAATSSQRAASSPVRRRASMSARYPRARPMTAPSMDGATDGRAGSCRAALHPYRWAAGHLRSDVRVPRLGFGRARQTRCLGEPIMDDMLTPRVSELVRQGHVVTDPLRQHEPAALPRLRRVCATSDDGTVPLFERVDRRVGDACAMNATRTGTAQGAAEARPIVSGPRR